MKHLIVTFLLLLSANASLAAHVHPEKYYQTQWCNAKGGIMEYKLNDKTRVDCLTPTLAVEVDFAPKWAECIGQAIYYGRQTNRQAACVLIMENGEKDLKYLKRLRRAAYKKGVNLKTFTIRPNITE